MQFPYVNMSRIIINIRCSIFSIQFKMKSLKIHNDLGPAGLRQPAVFGIYDLDSVVENRPAYIRRISGQNMFYKEAYDKWEYDHKIER